MKKLRQTFQISHFDVIRASLFTPEQSVAACAIQVTSTASDLISFNGQGQLCQHICAGMGDEIFQTIT